MASSSSASYDVRRARRAADAATPSSGAAAAPNKPDNTAFTQQRLPAWQPLLSAGTVLPLFFCLGAAFLAIGLGLHFSSEDIQERELDYTGAAPGSNCSRCAQSLQQSKAGARAPACTCGLAFQLARDLPAPVCLYYQLSGYYQNNRRYSVSRDNEQLSGSASALRAPAEECKPYRRSAQGRPIAPCGSIANSLFNDTFALYQVRADGSLVKVPLDERGISWWSDTSLKFHNPEPVNGSLSLAFAGTAKPPNWPYPAYDLGNRTNDTDDIGFVNEHFVVWMRTAALPTFRKLYSRVRQGNFSVGLRQGNYYLNITYNYPVLPFNGTKKVIFSTLSWMGGKNPFLGIAYLAFGSACILTGCVMLAVHLKFKDQNTMDL
ncbi:cell cycle control protein 50B [Hemicordylus capensis]|uniref:cell cycle control protein 50B n=1 Tax=Hemicordylus capensis TaxID=884348 RepID=UPI002303181D|nr:cell cycle control protein 50B [Hemicordylus capensis]